MSTSTFKKTKIVCTIGPASEERGVLQAMVRAGMDAARLNFSHGDYEGHARRYEAVRAVAAEAGREIAVMLDIQGPKIRTGPGTNLTLAEGSRLAVGTAEQGAAPDLVIDYPYLCEDLKPGGAIFLCDGMIELMVEGSRGEALICRVVRGGEVGPRKGVSLPGVEVRLPALTAKDIEDLKFGAGLGVDLVAVSFVRRADNLHEVRGVLRAAGSRAQVIAKIENQEALANIEEIVAAADGLMVARGDLGVEVPPEEVPLLQKSLIARCNHAGKPVITATEMLESMVRNPRPTRAEVTDIANAIVDGTDAIMLSAETAVGRHPVAAVEMMARVARRTESALGYQEILARTQVGPSRSVSDAISHATCQAALDLDLAAVITATQSGSTARMVARFRPKVPIIAATPDLVVARQLCLVWGIHPVLVDRTTSIDAMLDAGEAAAKATGLCQSGDLVAITAGVRTGIPGSTNLLKIHRLA
ncbi:MAG: pyruvate kinase [Patescibacteria group bacterium]